VSIFKSLFGIVHSGSTKLLVVLQQTLCQWGQNAAQVQWGLVNIKPDPLRFSDVIRQDLIVKQHFVLVECRHTWKSKLETFSDISLEKNLFLCLLFKI